MSKWLDKKKFKEWDEKKSTEQEDTTDNQSFYNKWRNPTMGSVGKPKEYEFRLLPDTDGSGYKGYFYHMFLVGETWKFFLCPKTNGLDCYCPWCQITQILYKGTASDKKKASDYKRKQKYVSNIFIINDPRDLEQTDDSRRVNGTVRLYEFPPTVEKMFKSEVTDKKNGYGAQIFNPEEDGFNFLLKIEAKKPDQNQKVWPDYAPSMFARRPSAIADSDQQLEDIMASRIPLEEYIKSLELPIDEHKKMLKEEMVWDDVESEFNKRLGSEKDETSSPKKEERTETKKTETKKTETKEQDDDSALLDELDSL